MAVFVAVLQKYKENTLFGSIYFTYITYNYIIILLHYYSIILLYYYIVILLYIIYYILHIITSQITFSTILTSSETLTLHVPLSQGDILNQFSAFFTTSEKLPSPHHHFFHSILHLHLQLLSLPLLMSKVVFPSSSSLFLLMVLMTAPQYQTCLSVFLHPTHPLQQHPWPKSQVMMVKCSPTNIRQIGILMMPPTVETLNS